MDKSVYSTEKISTGLAVSLETDQSSTRQFTILIRYLYVLSIMYYMPQATFL